jgi:catechol 2,3-dioxygenase-like lactoylglutathione lyase family enzyme
MDDAAKHKVGAAVTAIDHVQLAIPPGSENECRKFYVDLLGLREKQKPPVLAARGGLWLTSGTVEIHLGVEKKFRPAKKAHPAFRVTNLEILYSRLATGGYNPVWDTDLPNEKRFYVHDNMGNRLEFIEA